MEGKVNMTKKIIASIVDVFLFPSNDSKIHSLDPSSLTSFHQRSPTNNLPVTFLTVQKSAAINNITSIKTNTNESTSQGNTEYENNARNLNNIWNNIDIGWLIPPHLLTILDTALGGKPWEIELWEVSRVSSSS